MQTDGPRSERLRIRRKLFFRHSYKRFGKTKEQNSITRPRISHGEHCLVNLTDRAIRFAQQLPTDGGGEINKKPIQANSTRLRDAVCTRVYTRNKHHVGAASSHMVRPTRVRTTECVYATYIARACVCVINRFFFFFGDQRGSH